MYTREYDGPLRVPGGYSGVMIGGENKGCEEATIPQGEKEEGGILKTILHGGLFDLLRLPEGFKIGVEEILIIGAALLLIFSKSRDIECGIMLLALLFI